MMSEAAQAIAAGLAPDAAYRAYRQRRTQRLALQKHLTDFRLALQTLTEGLKKRDKVIIDADKLPGKRHLMLFDPELFRPPPPVLIPSDRVPRRERNEGP